MKTKNVRASVHRLLIYLPPIDDPIDYRSRVFCEAVTDDGHVGYGMAARVLTAAVAVAPTKDVHPVVKDIDPRDLEANHHRITRVLNERGIMTGVNLAARSCLDLALVPSIRPLSTSR